MDVSTEELGLSRYTETSINIIKTIERSNASANIEINPLESQSLPPLSLEYKKMKSEQTTEIDDVLLKIEGSANELSIVKTNPTIEITTRLTNINIVIDKATKELSMISEEVCNIVRQIKRESIAIETQAHFAQYSSKVLTVNIPKHLQVLCEVKIGVGEVSLCNNRRRIDLSFSQAKVTSIANKQKAEFGVLVKLEIENAIEQLNTMQDEEELKISNSESQSTCEDSIKKSFEDHTRKNHSVFNIDPLRNFFFLVHS
jgi:hypothetical protein